MNAELHTFVRDSLARGVPRAAIREALLKAGWPPEEADSALGSWAEVDFPVPVPRRRPYLSAREAFLHLVLFATLYVIAFNVGAIWFALINWSLHDPTQMYSTRIPLANAARSAVASLVIGLPVFLFVGRVIGRTMAGDPEKRSSRIRKWLTYLTLFLAALVMIGDLIVLVTAVLGGEVAPRFVLKVAVVFAIAGVVFGHYLADLRRDETEGTTARARRQVLGRLGIAGAVVSMAVGLWFVGSPGRERDRQLDTRRVSELRAIADAVDVHWGEHSTLPASLDALIREPRTGLTSITDPVTGVPYEYRTIDSVRFVLCAVFAGADSMPDPRSGDPPRFWSHGIGRTCYELRATRPPYMRTAP